MKRTRTRTQHTPAPARTLGRTVFESVICGLVGVAFVCLFWFA
jgi:hypothetical protein